jgi:hypothetical protein
MNPTSFEQSNGIADTPEDVTPEDVVPLSVFRGGINLQSGLQVPIIISCWKLTKEELELINKTGRIWLWIYATQMPPVSVEVKSPFESQPAE